MNFKTASDALFDRVTHEALASELGVSVAAIRQARLRPEAKAHRQPPINWEKSVQELAQERIEHYRALIAKIRKDSIKNSKL
jgi:phosphoenolpyruvate carboxylase